MPPRASFLSGLATMCLSIQSRYVNPSYSPCGSPVILGKAHSTDLAYFNLVFKGPVSQNSLGVVMVLVYGWLRVQFYPNKQ